MKTPTDLYVDPSALPPRDDKPEAPAAPEPAPPAPAAPTEPEDLSPFGALRSVHCDVPGSRGLPSAHVPQR